MATRSYERSVLEILTDLLSQFTVLLRRESQLARTEMSEKVSAAALGLGLIMGCAVLLIPALVVLLEAVVAGLERAGFAPHWAALMVGGGALLIGLILGLIGMNRLKADNLVPNRTIHQLREDASAAKRQMRQDDDNQRAA